MSNLNEVKSKLTELLDEHGLECHPFKVSLMFHIFNNYSFKIFLFHCEILN